MVMKPIRPSITVQPSWRETTLGNYCQSTADRYTKSISDSAPSVYGSSSFSISKNGGGVQSETRTYAKFFQPIVQNDVFYCRSVFASQPWFHGSLSASATLNGRALIELWLLKNAIDITTFEWGNQPTPNETDDLRFFIHIGNSGTNATTFTNLRPVFYVNKAGPFTGMYMRASIKTGTLANSTDAGASIDSFTVITKAPRIVYTRVFSRASSGQTRTLTVSENHPFKYGTQIEVSGVDAAGNNNYNSSLTQQTDGYDRQFRITAVTATTISYLAKTNFVEATTGCSGVILYN